MSMRVVFADDVQCQPLFAPLAKLETRLRIWGMEAIYEFDLVDMPVTVAVDSGGTSAHITGPAERQKRIAESVKTGKFKGITVAAR